ncbi:Dyp-type peroxidase [Streptomyces acidiscabies]|uniref:Tat-translocated enzyme n=1 Tax=Streptomyces acidiscabies TaxID=42234 RepID=A0A0L0K5S4_9ACTN|nr:Dyp-type peroxidase [Streptomyces acidiscabies]KND33133.1 Tat-translocated enzyme [Streptomyces acidiscabies]
MVAVSGCTRFPPPAPGTEPPSPRRQQGIVTPQQRSALVLALDLAPHLTGKAAAEALARTLTRWTPLLQHPEDPALTSTLGFGPTLPARLGRTPPELLRELPPFPGDNLTHRTADLVLQLCAPTPAALTAQATTLLAQAADTFRTRWRQPAHLPPTQPGQTPRNLLGFKDGTENPTPEERERWIWTDDATYLVVRRIHLKVKEFTSLPLATQEQTIGRHRDSGAPLGRRHEHDDVDVFSKTPEGRYTTPLHAHVRAASPRYDGGARMLRRGYTYDNGPADQGLLFLAYMRDPALFTRVQERLTTRDDLHPYTEHRASALAYIPPAPGPGEYLGERFLNA